MDIVTHYDLAVMCNRVYDRPDSELWTVQETDALVRRYPKFTIISFRGTEFSNSWPMEWTRNGLSNTRDVIRDLRFIPWRDPISRQWMHKGFGISAYRWFLEFHRQVPHLPIYLTGHSLGAGVAPHAARMLKDFGFPVKEVVLFGEPKGHYFGSAFDYQECDIRTVSYRHERDWIRFAGFGNTTVGPKILAPGDYNMFESHNIELYGETLKKVLQA